MPTIHFLNVKDGDCIGIEHNSGHRTVIDVCNAKPITYLTEIFEAHKAKLASEDTSDILTGNYNQKKYPVNPIHYFEMHGWSNVFRFILTHPDMDHMDGIKPFFDKFDPVNFWDTNNEKELSKKSWEGSPYSEDDWVFYKSLRDNKPSTSPKRLTLYSGSSGQYYNKGEDGKGGGDGLYVLAPTKELVNKANEADEDYNRCSYVLLYLTGNRKIVFGGDSHDDTWEHILNNHKDVKDIDILIAPHHGRKSKRSYDFLDVLNPKVTFFGNARSKDLAYAAWNYRNLPFKNPNKVGPLSHI